MCVCMCGCLFVRARDCMRPCVICLVNRMRAIWCDGGHDVCITYIQPTSLLNAFSVSVSMFLSVSISVSP